MIEKDIDGIVIKFARIIKLYIILSRIQKTIKR